jgi:adenylosuccinate synthase
LSGTITSSQDRWSLTYELTNAGTLTSVTSTHALTSRNSSASPGIYPWKGSRLIPASVLDDFDELKVAIAYTYNGETLESFPASLDVLENVQVVYKSLPGWKQPTAGAKRYEDLPENARKYIEFIEEFVSQGQGLRIKYIGTGRLWSSQAILESTRR